MKNFGVRRNVNLKIKIRMSKFLTVPLSKLRFKDNISRRSKKVNIHAKDFQEFAQSIKDDGMLNPITVEEEKDETTGEIFYNILAGERRYRAALLHGFAEVPVNVRETKSNIEKLFTNAIENELRLELSNSEKANLYKDLRDALLETGMSKSNAAATVAFRLKREKSDIERFIKIKEKLIPELFRAFEGRGGIPLTVVTASTYAALTPDEQRTHYEEWLAYGGRPAPDYEIRARHQPISHRPIGELLGIRRSLSKMSDKAFYWKDGRLVDNDSVIRILNWFLSKGDESPFKE